MNRRHMHLLTIIGVMLTCAPQLHAQTRYRFEPAPNFGLGLNNDGTSFAIGFSFESFTDYGIVYSPKGTETDFSVPGSADTDPSGINNAGIIVGTFDTWDGLVAGFVRRPNGSIATWSYPGSSFTGFNGLNDAGTILGYQQTDATNFGQFLLRPDGAITNIEFLGYSPQDTGWVSVNNDEMLFGQHLAPGAYGTQPVIAHNGVVEQIVIPDALYAFAGHLNNRGEACGTYFTPDFVAHGFVRSAGGTVSTVDHHVEWPATETIDYDGPLTVTFTADRGTTVFGNNDRGQLSGYSYAEYHGISQTPWGPALLVFYDIRQFLATPAEVGH